MADLKISALTNASTPLAGTEVLPIVQGGSTVKVAVSNLTAGRAVSALSFAGPLNGTVGATTPDTGKFTRVTVNSAGYMLMFYNAAGTTGRGYVYNDGTIIQLDTQDIGVPFSILNGGYETLRVDYSNVTLSHSNLVIGTSGKGIDFSATPGTGTSELLADYEEGTWTPNQGGGLVVVGAFSSSGTYTKVGRQVTVSGVVTGATSVNTSGSGIVCTNLPFAIATSVPVGVMTNTATNNSNVYGNPSTSTMYSSTATGVSGSLYFTLTYITS